MNKIRLDVHISTLEESKQAEMSKFLTEVDSNYVKLRDLCKGSKKKPCKRLTFTDCARKNPQELIEFNEYKKRLREERYGNRWAGPNSQK